MACKAPAVAAAAASSSFLFFSSCTIQACLENGRSLAAPFVNRKSGTNERGEFRGRVIWKFPFVGPAGISRLLFPELSKLQLHGLLLLCEPHLRLLSASGASGIPKLQLLASSGRVFQMVAKICQSFYTCLSYGFVETF